MSHISFCPWVFCIICWAENYVKRNPQGLLEDSKEVQVDICLSSPQYRKKL